MVSSMTSDDPYAPLCVHGVAPLVVDPSVPGGLRLGEPGRDAPDDCVHGVAQLPECEITLRVFRNSSGADAYIEAVREHGGNHVIASMSASHANSGCVLILRLDRWRPDGASTLDEAVVLRASRNDIFGDELKKGFAHARKHAMADHAEALKADAWRKKWAAELAFLESTPSLEAIDARRGDPGRPLSYRRSRREGEGPGSYTTHSDYSLVRVGDGLRVRGSTIEAKLDADLAERLDREREKFGVLRIDGIDQVPITEFSDASLVEAERRLGMIERERHRLQEFQKGRMDVTAVLVDPNLKKVLKRALAGFLPMVGGIGSGPGFQLSPKTGECVTVSATLLHTASRNGWLKTVWAPDRDRDGFRRYQSTPPQIFALTEAGVALAEERYEEAAGLVATSREQHSRLTRYYGFPPLGATVPAVGAEIAAGRREALKPIVEAGLPEGNIDVSLSSNLTRKVSSDTIWGRIVAGMLCGLVSEDDNGKLRCVRDDDLEDAEVIGWAP